jgi:mRNA interferase RelE/StbE
VTRAGRLRLSPEVVSLLRGLHPDLKRRLRAALDRIVSDPSAGKALRAELAGLRSLRVGRVRIVYRESRDAIEIVAVGPRERIYEETLRLVRRER